MRTSPPGRAAHAAEQDGIQRIEAALRATPEAAEVDFEAARQRALERVQYHAPSPVTLELHRRRNLA
ncbi:MAG: hypothetical protein OXC25_09790 [Thiotrichales bacterium]|nr:hypothetical protein [Thiotrichales bacterium]MCY4286823.1 hypothetical protein [Thiotrichales bacterium]MCY4350123.1 hypothetical protein [Thiotrichales bacterium]